MVIWIIGLAGVGKTTVSKALWTSLKTHQPNTVLIDGDTIRKLFSSEEEVDYSIQGRRKNAKRIQELCLMLDRQGINVVCAILSVFEETRIANRNTFSEYFEIYLTSPLELLFQRRPFYTQAQLGEIQNVVGIDIPFEEPKFPNMEIDTSLETSEVTIKRVIDSVMTEYNFNDL